MVRAVDVAAGEESVMMRSWGRRRGMSMGEVVVVGLGKGRGEGGSTMVVKGRILVRKGTGWRSIIFLRWADASRRPVVMLVLVVLVVMRVLHTWAGVSTGSQVKALKGCVLCCSGGMVMVGASRPARP